MLAVALLAPLLAVAQQSPNTPIQRPGAGASVPNTGQNQNQNQTGGVDRNISQDPTRRTSASDQETGASSRSTRRQGEQGDAQGRRSTSRGNAPRQGEGSGGPNVQQTGERAPGARGTSGSRQGGSRATGGSRGGGGGASFTAGASTGARTSGGKGAYEPAKEREIEYPELPEEGEVITGMTGPMPLNEFLELIRTATNWNILVSPELNSVILEFWITEATPKQAMEILKFHDIYFEYNEETGYLYVYPIEKWLNDQFGDVIPEEFVVQNADLVYIESFLVALLSSTGRLLSDDRTHRIYVWDTEDNLVAMRKMVADLDVPLAEAEFKVKNAEIADIETVLNAMLSPAGKLLADSRTGQIFVWDGPSTIDEMRLAVEHLDVPLETRTFYIQHVNGEDILDHLDALRTERGLIQVDPRFNAIIVTDITQRIEQMDALIKTLDQELETRSWEIDFADIDFIADQVEVLIPAEMGEVVVNDLQHQVTVTGLPARLDQIEELIEIWDVPRKQVQIEAFIVEVGSDVEREFNVNWSYFGNSSNSPVFVDGGTGFDAETGAVRVGQLPYAVPLYGALQLDGSGGIERPLVENIDGENVISHLGGANLAVTLDYLDQQNKATVLASPLVRVNDGEPARFENATRVPFISATTVYGNNTSTVNSGVNNTNRVEFIDVGTILGVTPRISSEQSVMLDIEAEDSTFVQRTIISNGQNSTVPEKTVRRAETQLQVKSGETVVLGGLRRDRSEEAKSQIPLLGDIPLVGRVFRYPNKKSSNNTLLIFITTTIVDDYTTPETQTLANAEATIADAHRHNKKDLWGRLEDKVSKGGNEISISIGQTGHMHSEGKRITLEELKETLGKLPENSTMTLVIRRHPRAPEEVVQALTAAAEEAGIKIELDETLSPIVPSYVKQDMEAQEKAADALENAVETTEAAPAEGAKTE